MNEQEDAVAIAPDLHEVIFENDKICVLKFAVKPGDKVAMHRHPENIASDWESPKHRAMALVRWYRQQGWDEQSK